METTPAEGDSICDGAITSQPTVLVEGLADRGWLTFGDGVLVYADSSSVHRVDRCTGAMTEIAFDEDIVATEIFGDWAYYLSNDAMGLGSYLHRVPIAGGDIERIGSIGSDNPIGLGTAKLSRSDEGVFALVRSGDASWQFSDVTERGDAPVILTFTSEVNGTYGMRGASSAGVYIVHTFDAGGPPPIRMWPYAGDTLVAIDGTANGIFEDVYDGGVIVTDPQEKAMFHLPVGGGERTLLLTPIDVSTPTSVKASSTALCWHADDKPLACVRRGVTDASLAHQLEEDSASVRSVALTDDVVYWLRKIKDKAVAAAPGRPTALCPFA